MVYREVLHKVWSSTCFHKLQLQETPEAQPLAWATQLLAWAGGWNTWKMCKTEFTQF